MSIPVIGERGCVAVREAAPATGMKGPARRGVESTADWALAMKGEPAFEIEPLRQGERSPSPGGSVKT
jgi:hypothetical protein